MVEYYYNIHDIITIKLVQKHDCKIFRLLNHDFSYFEVDELNSDPDITINIGKFSPSYNDSFTVDHRYYIKENYLYCRDRENRIKWEVEIDGFENGNTVVNFDYTYMGLRRMPCLPAYIFLLEGLLFYKLLDKGYSLIHAAGISKNGDAYLFAGRGGTHKTTLVMQFLKNGFKYLGDDKVILNENEVLSYPLGFQRFNYLYNNSETEKYRSYLDRMKAIRGFFNSDIDRSVVEDRAFLKKMFFVSKNKQNNIKINNITKKDVLDKHALSNILEMGIHGSHMPKITGIKTNHFYRYMLTYGYIFPKSNIATYSENLIKKLSENIDTCYEFEIPEKYDHRILNAIEEKM